MPTGASGLLEGDFSKQLKAHGDVAQLAEHLLCKQGVVGSNPIVSTEKPQVTPSMPGTGSRGQAGSSPAA
jgi:hypothetical protein